jgi:CheY-like chemotaxis protein/two-component sensor histidine kinase
MLRRRLDGDERAQRLTAGGLQAADRARTLIQRLLAFSRRQHLQARPVDVRALIDSMLELLARSLGPQITLVLSTADHLPLARVDPNQLELALLNLSVNARDAMSGEGTLTITVQDERVDGHAKLASGHYVRLAVADTGCGMDEETLRRAVEPFFTTKGVGHGTGLGLSMVHGLAAQSDGDFTLTSQPGRGTTAMLWLPVSHEGVADARGDGETDLVERRAAATILLVDDEELVRAGVADMLVDAGYRVVEADSGDAALQLVQEGPLQDGLVTDYAMPGMTGAELAREIRKLRPDLPVLMITGYATLSDPGAEGLPRLAKPFRQSELALHLAMVLDADSIAD